MFASSDLRQACSINAVCSLNASLLILCGRPFVKQFVQCYRTVVQSRLSCLSVCNVGVLWPHGWMDQNETWHGDRPRSRPHRVRRGPPKRAQPPIFGPCHLWPNGWMEDAAWCGGRPRPRQLCVRWEPSSPFPQKGHRPQFSAHV